MPSTAPESKSKAVTVLVGCPELGRVSNRYGRAQNGSSSGWGGAPRTDAGSMAESQSCGSASAHQYWCAPVAATPPNIRPPCLTRTATQFRRLSPSSRFHRSATPAARSSSSGQCMVRHTRLARVNVGSELGWGRTRLDQASSAMLWPISRWLPPNRTWRTSVKSPGSLPAITSLECIQLRYAPEATHARAQSHAKCHMCVICAWQRSGPGSDWAVCLHCFDDFAMMRPMLGIGKRVVRYPPTNDHQGFCRPHWRTSGGVSSNDASVAENRQITYGARVGTLWDAS
jgi:hypothetical protein